MRHASSQLSRVNADGGDAVAVKAVVPDPGNAAVEGPIGRSAGAVNPAVALRRGAGRIDAVADSGTVAARQCARTLASRGSARVRRGDGVSAKIATNSPLRLRRDNVNYLLV